MQTSDAIHARRTIKRFTDRPVSREQIAALLDAASVAPNHRLTQPARYHVLGPDARYAYGFALGSRKAKKLENADAARTLRETVAAEHRALPAMIAVAVVRSDNPEIAEENYASVMMGIQNLSLLAVDMGLGTALRTGAVMDDPAARAAAGVPDDERIVAVINLGEPAEVAPVKPRTSAADHTTWLA